MHDSYKFGEYAFHSERNVVYFSTPLAEAKWFIKILNPLAIKINIEMT